ncbi:MAG: glycolate oxidase subunit GlcE [Betaproteobacteria bacterium]
MEGVLEGAPTGAGVERLDPAQAELVERVRAAIGQRQAAPADDTQTGTLCVRGSGSKGFLGGPMQGEVLSTSALRGISSYEPSELVITARAGTPLAEVEAVLAEHGQCLAFEPPRLGATAATGTIGGVVAAGLAGPSRAAAGGVRDFMLGATVLNGRAEVLSFGGQVMKNVAGYDLARLMAGSMGVLGVVLEASIKVLPVAPATLTLRFDMDERSALDRLQEWGGQPLPINASAWWDGVLVLRLSGARAAVQSARERLGGELIGAELASAFWTGLRDQGDEFFTEAQQVVAQSGQLWRVAVPQTAAPLGIQGLGSTLIEWGGAQRWVLTAPGDEATGRALMKAARDAGGHAQVFRGPGSGSTLELDPVLLRIHRQLKSAFDPHGVFNRGRLHPDF